MMNTRLSVVKVAQRVRANTFKWAVGAKFGTAAAAAAAGVAVAVFASCPKSARTRARIDVKVVCHRACDRPFPVVCVLRVRASGGAELSVVKFS